LGRHDVWPGYEAGFIRRHGQTEVGDKAVPEREALTGLFGLVPHWAKDTKFARNTYNVRSETAMEKPSFRDAWHKAQHCIIPALCIFEPDWKSGKAIPIRIERTDDQVLGIAGLWANWKSPDGESIYSFSMLTINADDHPLMNQFHRPGEEKRMVVVLPEDAYSEWLNAAAKDSMDFMRQYPAKNLKFAPALI
jgi:putative SOS response-associated peptidase YedK